MAVLEAGIMFGGVPIVKNYYYNEKGTDSMLTAGLLEAIQLFAVEVFGDESESFKMKKPASIKDCMKWLARKFKEQYHEVDMGCLDKYEEYKELISKKMGDLVFRTEDRLRKVFT
ncbi:MAG: hypothetical protein ACTSP5_08830 [Candidatus Heimdallarchaeota archaeon]